MSPKNFTFMVLCFNHEKYLVEHLESIKFLIQKYATHIPCDLIMSDDFSRDRSVYFAESWLNANQHIFNQVTFIRNPKNLGTCRSMLNMCKHLNTDFCKLTASDDIYSYENIFENAALTSNGDIISGFPLDLRGDELSINNFDILNLIATNVIFKKRSLFSRFANLSFNNAPNIFYPATYLKSDNCFNNLAKFDVVEDLPIQIGIALSNRKSKFVQIDKVYVYYRRTSGSTYLVATKRFVNDQVAIYQNLIQETRSFFNKFLLKNRLFCFSIKNRLTRKLLNASIYLFYLRFAFKIIPIARKYDNLKVDIFRHKFHYNHIKNLAYEFKKSLPKLGAM